MLTLTFLLTIPKLGMGKALDRKEIDHWLNQKLRRMVLGDPQLTQS